MNKKLLPAVWLLAIGSIVLLSTFLQHESTHFFGIADNQEQTISYSYPVEIVQFFSVEGSRINQGKQILEVRRKDLGTKLIIIKDQIKALESSDREEVASIQAKVIGLRAQQAAELAEINSEIKTLLSQQRLNQSLLNEILGVKSKGKSKSPLQTRIQGLREQRGHIKVSLRAQIDNLQSQLDAEQRPVDAKIAELKERESEFKRQVTDLQVMAKFNGRVGSINYKPGEMVQPYQPILTVHALSPRYIKGYIHENVFNQVAVGQKVWVQSTTSTIKSHAILAIVESLGSRIVEYPDRLKKNVMVSAWGREAIIRLIEENSLLLGEKVIVTLTNPMDEVDVIGGVLNFFSTDSIAAMNRVDDDFKQGFPVSSLFDDLSSHDIEVSGIIQANNPDHFYIISDESNHAQPELYTINAQGEVIERLTIVTDKAVDNIDSISRKGNDIYVVSSLTQAEKKKRQLLKMRIVNEQVELEGKIDLYRLLESLSVTSDDAATRQFLTQAMENDSLQIEAHNVYQNDLYIGFKTPLDSTAQTVLIKIDHIDNIFVNKNSKVTGKIWRSIRLLDPETGAPSHLSDMLFHDDKLLLLGVNDNHTIPSSHLWSYDPAVSNLRFLKSFDQLKAEGMSATVKKNKVMVVFNGDGKQHSRFLPVAI